MSAAREPCGGAENAGGDTPQWSTWRAEGGVSADGKRYRIEWWSDAIKRALFRVATDDRVCVLLHVRTIRVQQRDSSRCNLDADAELEEIPDEFLERMRADGFTPADSGVAL